MCDDLKQFNNKTRESLYRFGRGVSFHEFEIAIGFENMEVIADGYSMSALNRGKWVKRNKDFENILWKLITEHKPEVPLGFTYPSLDLVIRKLN